MALRDLIRRGERHPERVRADEPFSTRRLFEDFWERWSGRRGLVPYFGYGEDVGPNVDVSESDGEIEVKADLPGLSEQDVRVSLSPAGDMLVLSGEKHKEHEETARGYYHRERTFGAFSRTIPLPTTVREEGAKAIFKNGVLSVTLPKCPEAARTRQIEVRGS